MDSKTQPGILGPVDSAFLFALQNSLSHLTGMNSVIVDKAGNIIADNRYEKDCFCYAANYGKKDPANCRQMVENMSSRRYHEDEIVRVQCPVSGVSMTGVPIFSKGEYLGVWIVNNVRLSEEQDYDRLLEKALKIGISKDLAEKEISAMPVLPVKQFDNYVGLIRILCTSLGNHTQAQRGKSSMGVDASTQVLLKLIDSSDVGMLITDFEDNTILLANDKAGELAGKKGRELTGKSCLDFFGAEEQDQWVFSPEGDGQARETPQVRELYIARYGKWFRLTNQSIKWMDGRDVHMVSFVDITESRRLEMHLAQIAFFDEDTALYNGAKLIHDISSSNDLSEYSFIFFDILSLRKINDAYGRRTGDGIIIGLVEWIRAADFGYHGFYRTDGDSFCLSFKGDAYERAERVAKAIYARCEEPWDLALMDESYHIFCNITMGVLYGAEISSGDNFINLMERTLDVARSKGGIAVLDEQMNSEFKRRLMMEVSLKNCVKQGMKGFRVYYQPIVNPITGIWVGIEALCRWESPEFGFVHPNVFIGEAEQLGLMDAIGNWVMEIAVADCKAWGLEQIDGFFLDVNVSALQLLDVNLEDRIARLLEKYAYPGEKLSLEITESMEFHITEPVIAVINKLRAMGLQVALDDFGTGYSSFNLLKSLPVTLLKTEKIFMENIEDDSYSQYLLYLMIELAHAADMKLVAEGVENEEQMRFLMRNGVDYMQGFLFSKPLSHGELEANLGNFQRSAMNIANMMYNKTEVERMMSFADSFSIAPMMYSAFNHCVQVLLYKNDWEEAVDEVIGYLGSHIGAGRVQVFLDPAMYPDRNRFSWCAPEASESNFTYEAIVSNPKSVKWIEKLKTNGLIVESDTAFIHGDFPFDLEINNIKSLFILPFIESDEIYGFLAVDTSGSYHNWVPDEIVMFYNIVSLINSTLKKERLQRELVAHSQTMDAVLNTIDVGIYVSDPDTHELLYANSVMTKFSGINNMNGAIQDGVKCYQAIFGLDEPCGQCKLDALRKNSGEGQISWEYYHRQRRKYYKVSDSIILWKGDKKAHIQYSVDITEIKEYQKKLRMLHILEGRQRVLDRETLAYALVNAVKISIEEEIELTTCALEIEYLSSDFDEGEQALKRSIQEKTEELLLKSIRQDDVVGKSAENIYVIGLLKCSEEVIVGKLERVLSSLRKVFSKEEDRIQFKYSCAFSDDLVKAISPDNILGIIDESDLVELDV